LCGSALDAASYARLLDGEKAGLVFTDPPYNVAVQGHVSGKGTIKHREFAMASGEMTQAEFTGFLRQACLKLAAHSLPGSIHYLCMDWRHVGELLAAGKTIYAELLNVCVWVKHNGGMGSLYRSQHEFVFVFKNGAASHCNNVQLGKHGRNRTNVWNYRGAVLDPFLGSGTTLIACERTGRRCRGVELDPFYIDTAIRRWQKCTGGVATNAATGQTFADREEALTGV
jgi:DNA modification methylase